MRGFFESTVIGGCPVVEPSAPGRGIVERRDALAEILCSGPDPGRPDLPTMKLLLAALLSPMLPSGQSVRWSRPASRRTRRAATPRGRRGDRPRQVGGILTQEKLLAGRQVMFGFGRPRGLAQALEREGLNKDGMLRQVGRVPGQWPRR